MEPLQSPSRLAALLLLSQYTNGRCCVWEMAGGRYAAARARIMSALAGRRIPQTQSGVTALQAALFASVGAVGDCLAAKENDFLNRVGSICSDV